VLLAASESSATGNDSLAGTPRVKFIGDNSGTRQSHFLKGNVMRSQPRILLEPNEQIKRRSVPLKSFG
jgi:gluconate kinase